VDLAAMFTPKQAHAAGWRSTAATRDQTTTFQILQRVGWRSPFGNLSGTAPLPQWS